jgi:hypothetical protein
VLGFSNNGKSSPQCFTPNPKYLLQKFWTLSTLKANKGFQFRFSLLAREDWNTSLCSKHGYTGQLLTFIYKAFQTNYHRTMGKKNFMNTNCTPDCKSCQRHENCHWLSLIRLHSPLYKQNPSCSMQNNRGLSPPPPLFNDAFQWNAEARSGKYWTINWARYTQAISANWIFWAQFIKLSFLHDFWLSQRLLW